MECGQVYKDVEQSHGDKPHPPVTLGREIDTHGSVHQCKGDVFLGWKRKRNSKYR